MPNERVVEIPWALQQLPQAGRVLDVGSCEAVYLGVIQQQDRELHCLDPRNCSASVPVGAVFHHQDLIGNDLPPASFDAVLLISVLEHIGLPCYEQEPFPRGDETALAAVQALLKPGAPAILTVPAGMSKLASWYRQYSPTDLNRLFSAWDHQISYWAFAGGRYRRIEPGEVEAYDYRESFDPAAGAGAVAGIVAYRR